MADGVVSIRGIDSVPVGKKSIFKCKKCESYITTIEKPINCYEGCNGRGFELTSTNDEALIFAREQLNIGYFKTIEILKEFLDTSEENYKLIALWILGTYFHSNFEAYPYLFFNAMRGSGKTRALKLISSLAFNGDGSVQNNLTEAVLFRIPRGHITCIDEVEQIGSKEKQTLREILNSAYKKGTKIKRMRKAKDKDGSEKQVVETYEPYFPIAMANIWGMDEVLGDRSLTLILEKSSNPAITMKIEDFERNYTIKALKRTFEAFSVVCVVYMTEKTYIEGWNDYINRRYNYTTTYNTITTHTTHTTEIIKDEFFNKIHDLGITGRNFELMFPLLNIADMLGNEIFEDFLKIAKKIVEKKKDDEYIASKDILVYEFVAGLLETSNFVSIKELINGFRFFIGESDEEERWINDRWLGRALKRLNLIVDKRRIFSGIEVTLNYEKAKEKLLIFKKEVKK